MGGHPPTVRPGRSDTDLQTGNNTHTVLYGTTSAPRNPPTALCPIRPSLPTPYRPRWRPHSPNYGSTLFPGPATPGRDFLLARRQARQDGRRRWINPAATGDLAGRHHRRCEQHQGRGQPHACDDLEDDGRTRRPYVPSGPNPPAKPRHLPCILYC